MEHKITDLFDLKIECLRHALFRQYAIATENYTNAMYYQLLYLDVVTRYLDIKKSMSHKNVIAYYKAQCCLDHRNL